MSKIIPLTQDKEAIVDDEDFVKLSTHKWFYAEGYAARKGGKWPHQTTIRMHNAVMDPPVGMEVDHIHGNKLDNRKSELRICTAQKNQCNKPKPKNNTSSYKGVTWKEDHHKWYTQIVVNHKHYFLGLFDDPLDAAKVYDQAARKYHGDFANTNFPKE